MAVKYIKFKVTAESLAVRKKPSLKGEVFSYVKKGETLKAIKGKIKVADGVKWRQIVLKDKKVWVSTKYLKRFTPNYRKRVVDNAKIVYNTIVKVGAKHEGGAKSLDEIKKKKKTTCATSVSAVLQESKMMAKGKLISHTKAVGSSKAVKKKNTKGKAISGLGNLKEGTYAIHKVGKSWKNVPKKYKVPGAILIYDSNIAIYKGEDKFYSANNGSSQKDSKGRYKSVVTGPKSYCGTSPLLYVIIPTC